MIRFEGSVVAGMHPPHQAHGQGHANPSPVVEMTAATDTNRLDSVSVVKHRDAASVPFDSRAAPGGVKTGTLLVALAAAWWVAI